MGYFLHEPMHKNIIPLGGSVLGLQNMIKSLGLSYSINSKFNLFSDNLLREDGVECSIFIHNADVYLEVMVKDGQIVGLVTNDEKMYALAKIKRDSVSVVKLGEILKIQIEKYFGLKNKPVIEELDAKDLTFRFKCEGIYLRNGMFVPIIIGIRTSKENVCCIHSVKAESEGV